MDGSQAGIGEAPLEASAVRQFLAGNPEFLTGDDGLLAAKAGATYVSPFIGRLDDIGQDGMQLIHDIRAIYDNFAFDTEILAASIRTPQHVTTAALAGSDCATIPPDVFNALFKHPLTERGLDQFMADWAKTGQSIL